MQVTDHKWYDYYYDKWRQGYYMDEFLGMNLMGIPHYLDKAWDVVGIISGHGKVRIGKSTMALQVAHFLAWLVAGGRMERDNITKKWTVGRKPNKQVHFDLKENVVFSPEDLMKAARDLHSKYGRNQVIVYDEGRAGLDSSAAMTAINRAMQDFFQECGMFGHIIIIVLPNFFKLHEDYAVSRSLFLIDVYADKKLRRGFFNFYNEVQKEWLYAMGKKKIGSTLKYSDSRVSFNGRFTQFLPFDKDEYEEAKRDALKKKQLKGTERKWKKQRDAAIYLYKHYSGETYEEMAKQLTIYCGFKVRENQVVSAIQAITHEDDDAVG